MGGLNTPNKWIYDTRMTPKFCIDSCRGDSSLMCGGNWRNAVYNTGITALWTGQCVVDNMSYDHRIQDGRMTPKFCIDSCRGRGFGYAGVQGGHHCFCSYSPPPYSAKVSAHQCTHPCSGDYTLMCGGSS